MIRLIELLPVVALILWSICATERYFHYKNLVKGLDKPELLLSRRERRAHARKLLQRENDKYTQQMIEEVMSKLEGEKQ